ncbi:hypothetical protein ANO11243_046010 [Dothideomycetidae sp. 11243]|nr:hypothetical protein ANO11243_046010 [fungal sp. No.11243]
MDHAHRKVELQSPADLQYIMSNASRAARSKIDLHFPPPATTTATTTAATTTTTTDVTTIDNVVDDDPLRKRVEQLVQDFLERTFAGVKSNVSINGLEGADMERDLGGAGQETEPFDHLLARRVQAVSSQIEAINLQLATLRREAPKRTAEAYTTRIEQEEQAWRENMRRAMETDAQRAGDVEINVKGLEDVDGMRKSWDEGTRKLLEVKDGVGGVQAKLEKARDAVGYLATA